MHLPQFLRRFMPRRSPENKILAAVYTILRLSVIAVMIAQFSNRNYENVLLCLLTLVLFLLPGIIERRLNIDVPDTLEIIILLFIYAAEILGEIREFYLVYPYWDTMLHTINGFLAAAIGLSMVDILNRDKRVSLSLSPFFVAVSAFCFSMTIGVMWELFEAGMDKFFLFDMQKDTIVHTISSVMLNPNGSNVPVVLQGIEGAAVTIQGNAVPLPMQGYLDLGLYDTMKDLLVNFIGALVFSIIGYLYLKNRGKGKFVSRFILVLKGKGKKTSRDEQP